MSFTVLFILMFILLLISVPVAFSIGLASIVVMLIFTDINLVVAIQRMFASIDSLPLLAVPLFILAGSLMGAAGLSQRLINLASSFVGHIAGGYAIVAVVASMFFGAISGSSVATVAAIGAFLIPAMIQKGYTKRFAAATQATAGELGAIIPPSIPMIIYGVVTGTSVGSLFIAGIVPGVTLAFILCIFIYFYSKKKGFVGKPTKDTWQQKLVAIKEAVLALIMPIIILGGIYGGIFTPTEAAAIAAFYAFIIGFFVYRKIKIKHIVRIFGESALTTSTIMIIISAAGMFSWLLTQGRFPHQAAEMLNGISESTVVFLLIVNLLLLILGMFFEMSAAIIILAPIITPIAMAYGIDPIHFGMIMIINLAIGMVTPPVAVNLFMSCKIAGISLEEITKGIIPYLLLLIGFLLLIDFIPHLSLWLLEFTK
ncbi:TRAP transporter large permease [Alkalihalobacillus oceani]|uniref:TRAP transporter large permease n=1 Tax=Halalkalibacter oceani TaxID=1653776 RepID=UPI00203C9ADC|nr:TRAP transporter large permease [Halalkalibacter oceani]MCM3763239.1 TRAP transporter large permease [Halalkalibacter oceani]